MNMILLPARPFYIYYDYIFGSPPGLSGEEEITERITPTTYIHTSYSLFVHDDRYVQDGERERGGMEIYA